VDVRGTARRRRARRPGAADQVQSRERVAVWAPNSPQWIILEFGAALAGLTLVTVNPAYRGEELAHLLGDSRADGLFRADTFQQQDTRAVLADVRGRLPRLREVRSFGDWDTFTAAGGTAATAERPLPGIDPASPAQVLYASGTTGRPKGAVLTHRGLTNNARLAFEAAGIGPDDVELNPMPMFHVGGSALFTSSSRRTGSPCCAVCPPCSWPCSATPTGPGATCLRCAAC
jgi:fatty-acyl-CoA synthase